jgi:hypothetical protein
MKTLNYLLMTAITVLLHITANSQTFVKVTNSPLNEPMEAIGSTWGDFDDDGDLDIFINSWTPSINNPLCYGRLFQNNCNGDFTRITSIPGNILKDVGTWAGGASWIDYNNDGFIDLYTSHDGGRNNSLYQNNGDGTFTQITDLIVVNDQAYTRGHTWGDLNNDGWLDLFLGNDGGNNIHQSDFLYLSTGPSSWIQITSGDLVNDNARTQGFCFGDYDNDGFLDIYTSLNQLHKNNGDGTFTKITNTIASQYWSQWSSSWVDIDNDLDLDLFMHGCFGWPSRMLINNGDGTFTALTNDPLVTTVVHNNGGQTWGDYDNDGDLDVLVSDFYKNQLYSNNGDGTFTRITTEIVGNDDVAEAYGATWNDYDKDGDLDLFIPNAFGNPPNYFYINTYQNTGNSNHWINIKCKGVQSNSSAIGARIYIKTTINNQSKWQMREINANHSCPQGGVNPLNQHFGIGEATIIDTVKIYWPKSGITQIFTNVTPDRYIDITEGDNNIYASKDCKSDLPTKNPGIVKGIVYNDVDNDCEYNSNIDYYLPNRIIKASVGDYYVITNDNGEYELRLPAGNYDINQIQLDNETLQVSDCPASDPLYNVNVTENQTLQGFDFVNLLEKLDCGVSFWVIPPDTNPCPGSSTQLCFVVYNNGPSISNFQTSITDNLGLITSDSPCNLSPLPANKPCIHCVTVTVPNDPLTYFNENIIINFTFSGICQGENISGSSTFSIPINCAYDPNDKTLLNPEGCGEENIIDIKSDLVYRLRFQNIGNAPAKDILVSDKLDENLDMSTFKILDVSHSLTRFEIIPDNNLIFKFDNIMLPDSASNPEGSNGYIVFSVKPNADVTEGTVIKNQAGIYFDYNAVVLTNTTSNLLMSDPKPFADFTVNHSCTEMGLLFDFYYSGNYTGIETFYWNFGNEANPQYSTEINPSNIAFLTTGYKNITLTVDRGGCYSTITKEVDIFDTSCGKDKVLVCHNGKTICISKNALPAHLAHGVCIGKCENENKNARIINEQKVSEYSLYYNIESKNVVLTTNEAIQDVVFQIYDNSGKLILSNSLNQVQEGNTYINVNNLAPGFYLGLAKTSNSKEVVKIIRY